MKYHIEIILFLLFANMFFVHLLNISELSSYSHIRLKRQLTQSKINGNSYKYGYYYLNAYFGSQKQKLSLIIDTGSSVFCITCKETCQSCGRHDNPPFEIGLSSSFEFISCGDEKCYLFSKMSSCSNSPFKMKNTCMFSISYGEQSSYKGYIGEDNILFNENDFAPNPIQFGCVSQETNLFYSQEANGILGLSPIQKEMSFIYKAKKAGIIKKEIFSLCYGINGGYITMGEVNDKYHLSRIKYFQYNSNDNLYKVNLNQISFLYNNNKPTDISIGQPFWSVIDSGSTVIYLPLSIFNSFVDILSLICKDSGKCSNEKHCFHLNNIEIHEIYSFFPLINFKIDNYIFPWYPRNYIVLEEEGNNLYCLGIEELYGDEIILGGTWMHNKDIIFDSESKVIGISDANCSDDDSFKIDMTQYKNNDIIDIESITNEVIEIINGDKLIIPSINHSSTSSLFNIEWDYNKIILFNSKKEDEVDLKSINSLINKEKEIVSNEESDFLPVSKKNVEIKKKEKFFYIFSSIFYGFSLFFLVGAIFFKFDKDFLCFKKRRLLIEENVDEANKKMKGSQKEIDYSKIRRNSNENL